MTHSDEITVAGRLTDLEKWWNKLQDIGPKYGYFPPAKKSWVQGVKKHREETVKKCFENFDIQISELGQRHLGGAIGSNCINESYAEKII